MARRGASAPLGAALLLLALASPACGQEPLVDLAPGAEVQEPLVGLAPAPEAEGGLVEKLVSEYSLAPEQAEALVALWAQGPSQVGTQAWGGSTVQGSSGGGLGSRYGRVRS